MGLFSKIYGSLEDSDLKIKCTKLWRQYILDHLRLNNSNYPKMRDYNFYSNGSATMSGKDRINFYYTIDGYPTQIPIDFKDNIRREARDGVRISFISTFEPTRIDWNSPQMISKIRTWRSIEEEREGVDEFNYYSQIATMDSMTRRKNSLVYLSDADIRRKRNLFKYRTMMIISGNRGENFDKTVFEVNDYCKKVGIVITRVETSVVEFLRAFSPFSMELTSDILKQVGSNTIPDEQIARFSSYDQGKIGRGRVMFGTDIFSGFSVYKEFKKNDTDAENVLITAETGGGKSFFLKVLLLQLLAMREYNGTINDIEGFEYIPMAGFMANHDSVVILNMAEGQGCYYDPFEITTTGTPSLDEDIFTFCKSFTNSYFRVLIGSKLALENEWGQKIINNAISKAYSDLRVVDTDPSTWSRTKGYGLFYVYDKFKDLYKECLELRKRGESEELELYERYKLNPGYLDTLDKVVAKLSEYFEPFDKGGIRSDVFRIKVSLSDIVNAKLVINSFGMAGKSADSVDQTQMALSQLSAANISHIRSIFSKAQGKFNFKVWEEFQRWGAFPDSANTIKTAITGGRKLGDVNFIVTNNVKELLDDDKFAIFDNITSFAIGAIASSNTRERLCKELSVPMLLPELNALVTKKGNTESFESDSSLSSLYDKAFLVQLDKSVTTIAKMILPKHIADSDIFKTGVSLEG